MSNPEVLFYPFHLCHDATLDRLLARFARVHFRDYMAIQLSPFFGTTAYPDRMGDAYPELVTLGRLVQGYHVSGPLSEETIAAVDRDLADRTWRDLFHAALTQDRRFRIGLGGLPADGSPGCLPTNDEFRTRRFTVAEVRRGSQAPFARTDPDAFDYGIALLKTSAALVYTVQLATEHDLGVATDSPSHHALLNRLAERDGLTFQNCLIERTGY